MFDSNFFKGHLEHRRREGQSVERGHRIRLDIDAHVIMASGEAVVATVIDMSRAGVRLKVPEPLFVGEEIELQLGRCGYVRVHICWSEGSEAGGRFLDLD